jgi:hypothetical protein
MKNKKWIYLIVLVVTAAAAAFIIWDVVAHRDYIDAFSGATPLALEKEVPAGLSLTVDGKVKQTYHFNSRSFRLLAKTRVRTPEITPGGEIMGAYIYTGIPVFYIMEGVVPEKSETDAFDSPMDMVVVFTSSGGRTARFSYGELTTVTDSLPVTLAYFREPVLPHTDPDTYTRNKYKENIAGLRLICPREPDTSRWLDHVERITLTVPQTPDHLLPPMQKGKKCVGTSIHCTAAGEDSAQPASYEDVPIINVSNWFRIGHGRGIKGDHTVTASGYLLPAFLEHNFPGCGPGDFFLFVACDGYRSIFSGREIFCTTAGNTFLLLNTMDGKPPKGGITIGTVSDFFVDRCVWGVTHVVRIPHRTHRKTQKPELL